MDLDQRYEAVDDDVRHGRREDGFLRSKSAEGGIDVTMRWLKTNASGVKSRSEIRKSERLTGAP